MENWLIILTIKSDRLIMKRLKTIGCFILILISSCKEIKKENKVAVVGKIVFSPVRGRNSSKNIVYFYKGVLYKSSLQFNTVQFKNNDMFLMFIDKTNPKNKYVPYPTQEIYNSRDFEKVDSINYYLDEEDLNRLDSIE